MKTKLENLIAFDDFKAGWRAEQAKKTKRTDTGLDILKEGIEEIIPEGSEDDNFQVSSKYGSTDDMIDEIKATLIGTLEYKWQSDDLDEGQIDAIVNSLREALLEMEQQGFVEDDFTDTLDEETDGDWIEWITQVVELENLPEEALNNIMDIIDITSSEGQGGW